jgi:hypothetical protein
VHQEQHVAGNRAGIPHHPHARRAAAGLDLIERGMAENRQLSVLAGLGFCLIRTLHCMANLGHSDEKMRISKFIQSFHYVDEEHTVYRSIYFDG